MAELKAIPIVALDVSTAAEALSMVRMLGGDCNYYKVGSELFTAAGPPVVRAIRELGHEVFLDLKFHDIPNTVAGSVRGAVATGASMLTVHASGGSAMLRAAVDAAGDCKVMAVTVLTSFTEAGLSEVWGRGIATVGEEVARLATLSDRSGVHGVVCSGHELELVRSAAPRLRPLVPGIRVAGGATHDQARVMTPEAAAGAGAAYLVIGRMVTGAADPAAEMRRVVAALG
jgi:orotidine-5'-phosphate decarboxylase